MAIFFKIIRDGKNFSAAADNGTPFDIGQRVRFKNQKTGIDFFGLSNDGSFFGNAYARKFLYKADEFAAKYAFMANFIEPTAMCEGQSFLSLNTYDRARFTFGFGQFAAHVPNGDFIRWFKAMLALPTAAQYFPDLGVKGNDIVRHGDGGDVVLADGGSTAPLQAYLNPSLGDVEDAEVAAAAKFMHWTVQDQAARDLQVDHMIDTALRLLKAADTKLGLDGKTADLCCIIFDILHQGRGGFSDMKDALHEPDPFNSLLQIGRVSEPHRAVNLTAALTPRRAAFEKLKWSHAAQRFA